MTPQARETSLRAYLGIHVRGNSGPSKDNPVADLAKRPVTPSQGICSPGTNFRGELWGRFPMSALENPENLLLVASAGDEDTRRLKDNLPKSCRVHYKDK